MKKRILYLIAFIFLSPITIFAQDKVSVKSIELEETNGNVEELSEAKANGLDIDVDVEFYTVGDSIKYKVEVENKDKEDYQLNTGKEFKTSDYIKYTYTFDDNSNILKRNTTKTMYVTLTYDKEVPDTALVNGAYTEDNDMSIGVLRDEANPKTGRDEIIVIAVVLGLVVIIGAIMIRHKQTKYLALVFGSLLVIIPTVHALKEVNITMSTKIKVEREMEFCVYQHMVLSDEQFAKGTAQPLADYYKFTPDMTFNDYYNSGNDELEINVFVKDDSKLSECLNAAEEYYNGQDKGLKLREDEPEVDEYTKCYNKYVIYYDDSNPLTDAKILPKSNGCYDYYMESRGEGNR